MRLLLEGEVDLRHLELELGHGDCVPRLKLVLRRLVADHEEVHDGVHLRDLALLPERPLVGVDHQVAALTETLDEGVVRVGLMEDIVGPSDALDPAAKLLHLLGEVHPAKSSDELLHVLSSSP